MRITYTAQSMATERRTCFPGIRRGGSLMYMDNHTITAPVCKATQDQPRQQQPNAQQKTGQVRLEISADKLLDLISTGALYATDVRCLDCESKQCVWRICLRSCIKHFMARPPPAG